MNDMSGWVDDGFEAGSGGAHDYGYARRSSTCTCPVIDAGTYAQPHRLVPGRPDETCPFHGDAVRDTPQVNPGS